MMQNSNLILGFLFILWGTSMLIKIFTGIDIPIFGPIFALFLIYLGIKILTGARPRSYTYHYSYRRRFDQNRDSQ